MVFADARGWDHVGNPFEFMHEPARERLALPALGEHTHEILRSFGYSATDIAALREQGIVNDGGGPAAG